MVFDSKVSLEEGSFNDVLFYYSSSPEDNEFRPINEAGILTTFLLVPEQFGSTDRCDYIFSGKREISLLHIGEELYFAASLLCNTPTHRTVLKNVLETCKNMLFLNLTQPKRNQDDKFDQSWKNSLKALMPNILNTIRWNDLVFTQLWNAYLPNLSIRSEIKESINKELTELSVKFDFIKNAIITLQDKVVSSIHYDDEVFTRVVPLLVNSKFKPYFPRKCKKRENVMRWIIGFVKEPDNSLTCFSPPIFYEGKIYALFALQLNKVRLILVIDPWKTNLTILSDVSRDAYPILKKCDHSSSVSNAVKKSKNFDDKIGVKLCHKGSELELVNHQIQPFHYNTIERGVLSAHAFGNMTGPNSSGSFPVDNTFISYYERKDGIDNIIVIDDKKNISSRISNAKKITSS